MSTIALRQRAAAELRRSIDPTPEELSSPGHIHWRLIQAMAQQLNTMRLTYSTAGPVDLAAKGPSGIAFYEMKSIDPDAKNYRIQARQAVAQLYEYRYRARLPQARLCLVTNAPPPASMGWLLAYLENDRGIGLLWTKDFVAFNGSAETRALMGGFC